MGNQRVVITGFGVMAPNGLGQDAFWSSLVQGRSGVGLITRFDTDLFQSKIAGEIRNFSLTNFMIPQTKICRIARHTQLVMAATQEALTIAELMVPGETHRALVDMPLYIGVSSSAMDVIEDSQNRLSEYGPARVPSYAINASVPQQTATLVAQEFGIGGETHVLSSACVSGMDAIAMSASRIQSGDCDIALAGGTDASIHLLPFSCLDRAGLASRRNDDPEKASRPFDQDADSGVISEGAAVVVLESLEHAEARGVKVFCEISGWGTRIDRNEILMSGMASAIEFALANAGRQPADIDMICAHGPGHPEIDRLEIESLKCVFDRVSSRIPLTSIKGSIGNPLAAAGPMQVAASARAIDEGIIPHIHNLDNPVDSSSSFDLVRGAPRKGNIHCALVNIHGLGGCNVSIVLERVRQTCI